MDVALSNAVSPTPSLPTCTTHIPWISQLFEHILLQGPIPVRMSQLPQRIGLNMPNLFPRHVKSSADILKSVHLLVVKDIPARAKLHHVPLYRAHRFDHIIQVLSHARLDWLFLTCITVPFDKRAQSGLRVLLATDEGCLQAQNCPSFRQQGAENYPQMSSTAPTDHAPEGGFPTSFNRIFDVRWTERVPLF